MPFVCNHTPLNGTGFTKPGSVAVPLKRPFAIASVRLMTPGPLLDNLLFGSTVTWLVNAAEVLPSVNLTNPEAKFRRLLVAGFGVVKRAPVSRKTLVANPAR